MILVATMAQAQQIELGAGRIAVLDPGFPASAASTSHSTVLDVESVPPVLLLMGLKAGTSVVTVERADGTSATWNVVVDAGNVAPVGGPGLLPPGDALQLPVGEAAVCTIPLSHAFTRLDLPGVRVTELGTARWLVGVDAPGHADVVFQLTKGRPVVLPVASGTGTSAPAGCLRATETLRLTVGEDKVVQLGKAVSSYVVQSPNVAYAAIPDGSPNAIKVTGVRTGTTTLVVRSSASDPPQLRTIEVVAP